MNKQKIEDMERKMEAMTGILHSFVYNAIINKIIAIITNTIEQKIHTGDVSVLV